MLLESGEWGDAGVLGLYVHKALNYVTKGIGLEVSRRGVNGEMENCYSNKAVDEVLGVCCLPGPLSG